VPKYAHAIVGEVLVQSQPRKAPTQQARERRLARFQRLAPQVLAIQLQEVEGVEEDMLARRLAPQPFEHREPVLIAGDRLVIDQTQLEPVNCLDDERIAVPNRARSASTVVCRWSPGAPLGGSRRA